MKRSLFLVLGLTLGVLAVGVVWWWQSASGAPVVINETAVPPVPTLDPARVAQGETLYAQYCAQCHGASLEGAPEWKKPLPDGSLPAPPHDDSGHTWHHADKTLLDITLRGGQAVYGDANTKSNMPAFEGKLTADEAATILDFFKSRWGNDEREFQWWITATQDGVSQSPSSGRAD